MAIPKLPPSSVKPASKPASQGSQAKKKPRVAKADLVSELQELLTDKHWELIHQLIGREIGGPRRDLNRARFTYLCNLFHRTSGSHGTHRDAAQDLQKQACELYSAVTGIPWGSSRDDQAEIKPRQSGQAGTDVVLSPRIKQELIRIGFPDCCECKNVREWNLQQAVRQARANTPKSSSWLLVMKRRGQTKDQRIEPVVILDLEVFKKLILACLGGKGL